MAEFLCRDAKQVHFDEFIPYVAVNVAGVPSEVIGHMVRLSAIELAQTTKAIKRTYIGDAQCGVRHYTVELNDCYSIVMINEVAVCNQCLRQVDIDCCLGDRCGYAFERPEDLYIGAAPDQDQPKAIELHLVVSPGQDSCNIDKWVYDQHAETIAQGALYRILSMSGEEWFNPPMASLAARVFNAGVSDLISRDRVGYSLAPRRVPMPGGFLV